ncbi:hypothetical protein [Streptomyces sp. AC550_RSS872]|uniref:hypothetical protein n=1 Tax=Streptomyces sp. AC550_RSS872 TaxID=2823689 RepID=UPI001C277DD9|nr:hypothetical protein [Streptomyces sp. AC550_RSS872]
MVSQPVDLLAHSLNIQQPRHTSWGVVDLLPLVPPAPVQREAFHEVGEAGPFLRSWMASSGE